MDGSRALVLKRSLEYEDLDAFRRCRAIYQKIGFVLDKWEESAGDLYHKVSKQELLCAEKFLDEAEKNIWRCVARQMAADAIAHGSAQGNLCPTSDPHKHPLKTQLECVQREVMATQHSAATNNQVVRVQRSVQVQNMALQHADQSQPKMLSLSSNQQVANLLVNWYITLGEKGVHLEGLLLNEGRWKTSPIAVRVGPTTVKSTSGTTYNICGEMFLPEGVDIPDFVYKNFRNGFPNDWQEVISLWVAFVKNQRRLEVKENVGVILKKDQEQVQIPTRGQGRATNNKTHHRVLCDDQDKMPPPGQGLQIQKRTRSKEDIRLPVTSSILKKSQYEEKAHVKNEGTRPLTPLGRRVSNRVLMKSLTDTSVSRSSLNKSQEMCADVNCLKKWDAEVIPETSELVLVGQLVSSSDHVIDRNFISSCIMHRIQPDLIETVDGEIYRLLGPAESSEMKLFRHGFPLQWKALLKRSQFPVRTSTANAKASRWQDAHTDRTAKPSQDITKNSHQSLNSGISSTGKSSLAASSVNQQRRTSQMIQQLVRHNIKQDQNSTTGSKNNYSLMGKKNESSVNKRKNNSLLPIQQGAPLKKMRPEDTNNHSGGTLKNQHKSSEVDLSSDSELNVKQRRVRDSTAVRDKKPEAGIAKVQSSQQGNAATIKNSTARSPLNTTGKYLAGLTSDVGSGEFDFNIF